MILPHLIIVKARSRLLFILLLSESTRENIPSTRLPNRIDGMTSTFNPINEEENGHYQFY